MSAAQGRDALDQLQPVRQKHTYQRTHVDIKQALYQSAIDGHSLRLTGRKPNGQFVRTVVVLGADDDSSGGFSEVDKLALISRPAGAAGAAEVDRFKQVRLARSIRTMHDGQSRAQLRSGAAVAAEVPDGY
jgi:hypothetical protein